MNSENAESLVIDESRVQEIEVEEESSNDQAAAESPGTKPPAPPN